MKTRNGLVCSLAIVFCAFAQYDNQSNLSETGTVKPLDTTTVRINNTHAKSDTGIVIGNEATVNAPHRATSNQLAEFQSAIKTGKGLATAGIILHFTGLALGSLESFSSSSDPGLSLTLSLAGTAMEVTGPILACAGGSRVHDAAERAGFQAGIYPSWHEYGAGWGFTGGGLALIIGGVVLASNSSSNDGSPALLGLVLAVGGAALAIVGEVKFIKASIHSAVYISKQRELMENRGLSFHLVPTWDVKRKNYGLALVGTF